MTITPHHILRHLMLIVIIVSVIVLLAILLFLYQSFYRPLTHSTKVLIPSGEILKEYINPEMLDTVVRKEQARISATSGMDIKQLKNPFASKQTKLPEGESLFEEFELR